MSTRIRNPQDCWLGLLYLCLGSGAIRIARGYDFGSTVQMEAGFLPTILGGLLVIIGVVSLGRSLRRHGAPIGPVAWKPLAVITASILLFAYLLPRGGSVIALAVLLVTGAASSRSFRLDWRATIGLIALIAFCVFIFGRILQVPMPLLGNWFTA